MGDNKKNSSGLSRSTVLGTEGPGDVKLSEMRANSINSSQEEKRRSQLAGMPGRVLSKKASRPKVPKEGAKKAG